MRSNDGVRSSGQVVLVRQSSERAHLFAVHNARYLDQPCPRERVSIGVSPHFHGPSAFTAVSVYDVSTMSRTASLPWIRPRLA